METCSISYSAVSMAANCSINLSSAFNIPTRSYSHTRHSHPIVVFSVKTDEKLPDLNGAGSQSSDLTSTPTPTPTATVPSEDQVNGISSALAAVLCNAVDDLINNFIDNPLRPFVDPRLVLAGNFAPVQETAPVECDKIQGTLPACVDGVYIRNGPNPRYVPRGGHHLFDGDGMLHAVRIKDGRVTFCSRYVRTHKFVQEETAGGRVVPNFFSGFYSLGAGLARGVLFIARVALGLFNPYNGAGLANTSLLYFNRRLMALEESDLPYAMNVTESGDMVTVGRYDFDGKLFMAMTAHPKIDPQTRELFAFRCSFIPPFLNYFRVSPAGEKEPDVGILSMLQPSFIHDFAITKLYAIFPDTQIVVDPMNMIVGGSPMGCDPGKVPRLGVLPRYATDEAAMKWFQVPGFNFFHSLNAWDEGDEIVLIAANLHPVEHVVERTHLVHSTVEKVRINLRNGIVSRKPLSSKCLELGVINPRFVGKKNRYAYMSIGAPLPKLSGVVKLDFDMLEATAAKECVVASRAYGEGCFGSEPFFVARSSDPNAEEEDGYIVAFTHNECTGISSFLVMDAQSPTLQIVASVELPARVPYGFHGLFVSDADLANQN